MDFKRASRRADLKGFRLHDLRHDFCSWLTMRGVPPRAVQKLAGHADLRMTERYSHPSERILVEAVSALPALPTTPLGSGNGHGTDQTQMLATLPEASLIPAARRVGMTNPCRGSSLLLVGSPARTRTGHRLQRDVRPSIDTKTDTKRKEANAGFL